MLRIFYAPETAPFPHRVYLGLRSTSEAGKLGEYAGILVPEDNLARDPETSLLWNIGDLDEVGPGGDALAEGAFGLAFCSVSAGIFDHEDHLVAAMTILGMSGRTDLSAGSNAAQLLQKTADELSAALGSTAGAR
ncbi:hypothetical protein KX729_12820 [Rhizobium sp. XQZ8]|uniref:hypothetical protein n=1 Tax=Rhizobium populisoli TaxID=2859785 RepID=UPI001CA5C975|nr:hypothetical protein [Rhizobium populisoli]MBW6422331.1 hypothetical protein [Rhizobium populisoli]